MPLYIFYEQNGEEKTAMWATGLPFPVYITQTTVTALAADKEELQIILRNFKNIPYHGDNIVRWPGFWGQFILQVVWEYSGEKYRKTEEKGFLDIPACIRKDYMDAIFCKGIDSEDAKGIRINYKGFPFVDFFDAVDEMKRSFQRENAK